MNVQFESLRVPRLFAEVEALEQLVVLGEVVLLQIVEKLAPATGEGQQTAAGVKVLAVGAQVIGEVVDAGAQKSDLDVGRTGVRIVRLVVANDRLLIDCFAMCHLVFVCFELRGRTEGQNEFEAIPSQDLTGLDAAASVEAVRGEERCCRWSLA